MLPEGLLTVSYIAAGVLFILSLGGLSNQETAGRGNTYGILGMAIAILATLGAVVGGFPDQPVSLTSSGIGVLAAAILPAAVKVRRDELPRAEWWTSRPGRDVGSRTYG